MKADIKPLPGFVKLIETAAIARGDQIGPFKVWPSARPTLSLEPGVSTSIAIRIRLDAAESGELKLVSDASDGASYSLRREGSDYWLNIAIKPSKEASSETTKIILKTTSTIPQSLTIHLTTRTPEENVTVTPRSVALGDVALSSLKTGSARITRIGVRKVVGSFRVRSVSSTLEFLKLESQTIVDGSNYLIRVSIDPQKIPPAGQYAGVIRIETDDAGTPRMEVPVTLTLVNR